MLNNSEILQKIELLNSPYIEIYEKNKLAILLSETKDERVFEVLCKLITDTKYINSRGTFVHCLRSFPPEKSFSLAIDLLINGNFEVAHEAFEIIDNIEGSISGEEVAINYTKLVTFYNEGLIIETWRKKLIEDSLEMFE